MPKRGLIQSRGPEPTTGRMVMKRSPRVPGSPSVGRRALGVVFGCAVALLAMSTGCSTPLAAARAHFYNGQIDRAGQAMEDESRVRSKDRVLFHMERGTVRQASGRYEESARDFITAQEALKSFETYSLSKGAASLVVNDNVQPFLGTPYERALLHAMTAFSHMAMGAWNNVGVEARRLIETLDPARRGDFPEDALTRYVAGLAFELEDDPSNAAIQYRKAAELAPAGTVIAETGRLGESAPSAAIGSPPRGELICFILAGQGPSGHSLERRGYLPYSPHGHAEIYIGGTRVGRSYPLADVAQLALVSEQKLAALRAAKTVTRVVLKDTASREIGKAADSKALGDLVFLLLLMLEQPDYRRWETLPRSFQVARVPCPLPLDSFEIHWTGQTLGAPLQMVVTQPLQRRRNLMISVVRDVPSPPPP